MTMDEVNERFPLTKYKTWVATRAMEGLPTAGGVVAPASRAASLRDVDGVTPSSPVGTKHSVYTRPPTAASEEVTVSASTNALGGSFGNERKSMDAHTVEKGPGSPNVEEHHRLEEADTTASTVNKQPTTSSEDDDDDDDHIHTAVPPELLTNPGDSCAICLDTLEEDDDIRGLTCGHAFHAGCLDPWLTSRRACCPLCKADYYIPKPRPEGEAAEADRSGRRGGRMPQAPSSAWTGLRGNPRLILPGRFMAPPGDAAGYTGPDRRARRAALREALAAQEAEAGGAVDGAAENSEQAAPSRWHPNISNPFRNVRVPTILSIPGRARIGGPWHGRPSQGASPPADLESGTVR